MTETPLPSRTSRAPLTRAEESALARRIEAGVLAGAIRAGHEPRWAHLPEADLAALERDGRDARDELVRRNAGLVWYVVHNVADRAGLDRDELFQEGMGGLLEAVDRFDHARGGLAAFAVHRIRLRVWEAAVTANGAVCLPPSRARQWRAVRRMEAELSSELRRRPTADEVARACALSVATVAPLLTFRPPKALAPGDDAPRHEPEPRHPVGPAAVSQLLLELGDVDRTILTHRYGLGGHPALRPVDVGRLLGLSESTVRRRERLALARLRSGVRERAA